MKARGSKGIIKFSVLTLLVFGGVSCSSLASNPNACREAPPLLPLPHSVAGPILQFSPCTSIEFLRIETGDELNFVRDRIFGELEENSIGGGSKLFARRMGCAEAEQEFFYELQKNRYDIFGKEIAQTNRQAVIMMRKITKTNPILKEACWKR